MIITNFKKLAKNDLRKKALQIVEAGYEAIDIKRIVSERINLDGNILEVRPPKIGSINIGEVESPLKLNLDNFKRVFVIGIGKVSALASVNLARILSKRLSGGITLDISMPKSKIQNPKFKVLMGTHPLPSKQNVIASQKIIKLAKNLTKDDLLITFICGGGSALLCDSEKEMKNSILVTKLLTQTGANIIELNTARKHLSGIKGGGLVRLAYP